MPWSPEWTTIVQRLVRVARDSTCLPGSGARPWKDGLDAQRGAPTQAQPGRAGQALAQPIGPSARPPGLHGDAAPPVSTIEVGQPAALSSGRNRQSQVHLHLDGSDVLAGMAGWAHSEGATAHAHGSSRRMVGRVPRVGVDVSGGVLRWVPPTVPGAARGRVPRVAGQTDPVEGSTRHALDSAAWTFGSRRSRDTSTDRPVRHEPGMERHARLAAEFAPLLLSPSSWGPWGHRLHRTHREDVYRAPPGERDLRGADVAAAFLSGAVGRASAVASAVAPRSGQLSPETTRATRSSDTPDRPRVEPVVRRHRATPQGAAWQARPAARIPETSNGTLGPGTQPATTAPAIASRAIHGAGSVAAVNRQQIVQLSDRVYEMLVDRLRRERQLRKLR